MTHLSSPEGWRRSGHSSLSYSGHSGDLQHSLYTHRSLCCRHTGPHSPSPQHCRYSLAKYGKHESLISDSIHIFVFERVYTVANCFLIRQGTAYVCRHQDGPFGCGGWAGSPGNTGHTLALLCGAYSPHTHLHSSTHWPRTLPDQNDSARRGCYTDSLRRGRKGYCRT